jgi:hypothetical protein
MLTADKITKVAKTTEPRPLRAPRAHLPRKRNQAAKKLYDEKGGAELGKIGLSAHDFGTTE